MDKCDIILTDSGSLQEEGQYLGKSVLVMRDVTERPEAVDSGRVKLAGNDSAKIVSTVEELFEDVSLYEGMAKAHNPYGDGKANQRILDDLRRISLITCPSSQRMLYRLRQRRSQSRRINHLGSGTRKDDKLIALPSSQRMLDRLRQR